MDYLTCNMQYKMCQCIDDYYKTNELSRGNVEPVESRSSLKLNVIMIQILHIYKQIIDFNLSQEHLQ